jgi:cellobiose phosphorylase
MVAEFIITNTSAEAKTVEFYTHLEATLRTSHTYASIAEARCEYDEMNSTIFIDYHNSETGNAELFISNVGHHPTNGSIDAIQIGSPDSDENQWKRTGMITSNTPISSNSLTRPVAVFLYHKVLEPNENMKIVQLIGMDRIGEGIKVVKYLKEHYMDEVNQYKQHIYDKVYNSPAISTGDSVLDKSTKWAKAILTANQHYIDDEIIPMPCPAEYNFYFTHDVLLTDLAATLFDVDRVKKDLTYIIEHASTNNIIPHAYYWKNNAYHTEWTGSDNWNHFWFILLAGSYYRHSGDIETLDMLLPYIKTSLKQVLNNKKEDNLLWASHPDWWDAGGSYGPRAYMTILAIQAIKEFIFISYSLYNDSEDLLEYENLAEAMIMQLNNRLWDEELGYLINYYKDGTQDSHLYTGSLLAVHFGQLNVARRETLMKTAESTLLDKQIGIYNVYPMDFHNLEDFLEFQSGETGGPHLYFNGGVWPHGNAWYVLGLKATGRTSDAFEFLKNVMSIDGIIHSPNGQPAMYEYRNSNRTDPLSYGKVDKPQFTWAAGWYLYSLYNILGINENLWNISLKPYVPNGDKCQYSFYHRGELISVTAVGSGQFLKSIKYDGKVFPSAVIPGNASVSHINLELGEPRTAYIANTQAVLQECRYDLSQEVLLATLKAFPGHRNSTQIVSPISPRRITINGQDLTEDWIIKSVEGAFITIVNTMQISNIDTLLVKF